MRHSGYHVGIRKKVSASPDQVWECFTAPKGLSVWLEDMPGSTPVAGLSVRIDENGELMWLDLEPNSFLRFKYRLSNWEDFSYVQIRIIGHPGVSVVQVLQENIPDLTFRETIRKKLETILIPEFIC